MQTAGDPADYGYVGGLSLSPTGIRERTASEVLRAADTGGMLEVLAMSRDIYPRCSASMDPPVHVCEDHDAADGPCDECDSRNEVSIESRCMDCPHTARGFFELYLLRNIEPIAFVASRGFHPISPTDLRNAIEATVEVLSTDPFEARFTFAIGEDSLTLAVDDDLTVVDVQKEEHSEID